KPSRAPVYSLGSSLPLTVLTPSRLTFRMTPTKPSPPRWVRLQPNFRSPFSVSTSSSTARMFGPEPAAKRMTSLSKSTFGTSASPYHAFHSASHSFGPATTPPFGAFFHRSLSLALVDIASHFFS